MKNTVKIGRILRKIIIKRTSNKGLYTPVSNKGVKYINIYKNEVCIFILLLKSKFELNPALIVNYWSL